MKLVVRQERIRRNWTQEYVAQQIGTTLSTVQKIETGQRKPSYEVLVKMLHLFGKTKATKEIRQLFAVADEAPISQENSTTKEVAKSSHKM